MAPHVTYSGPPCVRTASPRDRLSRESSAHLQPWRAANERAITTSHRSRFAQITCNTGARDAADLAARSRDASRPVCHRCLLSWLALPRIFFSTYAMSVVVGVHGDPSLGLDSTRAPSRARRYGVVLVSAQLVTRRFGAIYSLLGSHSATVGRLCYETGQGRLWAGCGDLSVYFCVTHTGSGAVIHRHGRPRRVADSCCGMHTVGSDAGRAIVPHLVARAGTVLRA
jgi:hypothetical protein